MYTDADREDRLTELPNKKAEERKKREENESKINSSFEQSQKREVTKKNRIKKVKRRKRVLKRVVALGLAAVTSLTLAYTKGVNDLRKVGYETLNSANCYVKTIVDGPKQLVAFDSKMLYDQVNPDYREFQPEDYPRMAEILSAAGYTDPQITIILNDLCGIEASSYVYGDNIPSIDEIIIAGIEGTNGLGKSNGRGM